MNYHVSATNQNRKAHFSFVTPYYHNMMTPNTRDAYDSKNISVKNLPTLDDNEMTMAKPRVKCPPHIVFLLLRIPSPALNPGCPYSSIQ